MKTDKLLLEVMNIQTESYKSHRMERFIKKQLKKMKLRYELDDYGNIYVTKGKADLYPTMVSHIDTVHKINNNVELVQIDNCLLAIDRVTMERYGIGGDDKVGVYITLKLLQKFENFKAVFFKDEEVGCVGSGKADFSFFNDSTIVLECDRRGIEDFVTNISGTVLSNDDLHTDIDDILTKYKRKKVTGGITDVGEIAEQNEVQVANMSCGYYDPHSDNEYIVIDEVNSTMQMCYEILRKTEYTRYTIPLDNRIKYSKGYGYGWEHIPYTGYDQEIAEYEGYNVYSDKKISEVGDYKSIRCQTPCTHCGTNNVWFDEFENEFYCTECEKYIPTDKEGEFYDELYEQYTKEETTKII